MSKFKTGDLVRYVSSSFGVLADDGPTNEWRASRIGLIMFEAPRLGPPRLGGPFEQSSTMYNVLWNDNPKPLIVPDWNLELVQEEG